MIGSLLGSLMRDSTTRSPRQRTPGHRHKNCLIDPRYRAQVVATAKPSLVYPDGYYEVKRDGILTHIIVNAGGWFVRCVGRNGVSGRYKTAKLAAEAYRLVIGAWKSA